MTRPSSCRSPPAPARRRSARSRRRSAAGPLHAPGVPERRRHEVPRSVSTALFYSCTSARGNPAGRSRHAGAIPPAQKRSATLVRSPRRERMASRSLPGCPDRQRVVAVPVQCRRPGSSTWAGCIEGQTIDSSRVIGLGGPRGPWPAAGTYVRPVRASHASHWRSTLQWLERTAGRSATTRTPVDPPMKTWTRLSYGEPAAAGSGVAPPLDLVSEAVGGGVPVGSVVGVVVQGRGWSSRLGNPWGGFYCSPALVRIGRAGTT